MNVENISISTGIRIDGLGMFANGCKYKAVDAELAMSTETKTKESEALYGIN